MVQECLSASFILDVETEENVKLGAFINLHVYINPFTRLMSYQSIELRKLGKAAMHDLVSITNREIGVYSGIESPQITPNGKQCIQG